MRMYPRLTTAPAGWTVRVFLASAAVLLPAGWRAAIAEGDGGYRAHVKKALAPMHQAFTRIAETHGDDPAVKGLRRRLELINTVAEAALEGFRSARADALDGILDDITKSSAKIVAAKPKRPGPTARDLYFQYRDDFAAGTPATALTTQESKVLKEYHETAARAAGRYVVQQCTFDLKPERAARDELTRLCVVLPLLNVPDAAWSDSQVQGLPDRLKSPGALKVLEAFALSVRRPLTAARFARARRKEDWDDERLCDYLLGSAERLIGSSEYHAAAECLETAIRAGAEADAALAMRAYCELAELREWLGHPQLGASTAETGMRAHPKAPNWPRAAVIRLKCLYRAGRYCDVIREAEEYREDDRCRRRLPQILYISWIAHRRERKPQAARALREEFVKRFPDSILCADMHFVAAVDWLTLGEPGKAERELATIDRQYPRSPIVGKVEALRKRMKAAGISKAP